MSSTAALTIACWYHTCRASAEDNCQHCLYIISRTLAHIINDTSIKSIGGSSVILGAKRSMG